MEYDGTWNSPYVPAVGGDGATVSFSRATAGGTKIPITIELGSAQAWQGLAWTVWATLAPNYAPGGSSSIDGSPLGLHGGRRIGDYQPMAGIDWEATIYPSEIITDTDRPGIDQQTRDVGNLPGNPNGVPSSTRTDKTGSGFSGWDISRQQRMKVQKGNPDKWPPEPMTETTETDPVPGHRPIAYPTNDVEGNDDTDVVLDEDCNPYPQTGAVPTPPGKGETGRLRSNDEPYEILKDTEDYDYQAPAEDGDTLRTHWHWREFVRVQLGTEWYRCSDWGYWRWHYYAKRLTGEWNAEPARPDVLDDTNNDFQF